MGEVSKERNNRGMGLKIEGAGNIPCLLWMDDIALIHENERELLQMSNCTNDIAKIYHIDELGIVSFGW